MGRPLVSLVLPFRNEAAVLPATLEDLRLLAGHEDRVDFEFVFVDDGSSDGGAGLVRLAAQEDNRFRLVRLSRGFGKEAAMTAGIRSATGAAVVPMDADGQDPASLISRFIDHWLDGAQVVLGRRRSRANDTWAKRSSARAFYWLFNRITSVQMPPDVGDFRLMDRAVVDAFLEFPERERFLKGLFAYVGFEPVVVDYERQARSGGETKFSPWRLWNFALDGLFSFSSAPLRMWTYVGSITAALTMLYAAFIFGLAALGRIEVSGYASIIIAVLMMGALNLIGVGIVGEYLGRVYLETKQRPRYFIEQTV